MSQINQNYEKEFNRRKIYAALFILLVMFVAGTGLGFALAPKKTNDVSANKITAPHTAFLMELYEQIQANYWEKVDDDKLINLYKLALEKASGQPQTLNKPSRATLTELLRREIDKIDADKKRDFVVTISDLVLANLTPAGRSRLYSQKAEKDLRNKVAGIDKSADLYKVLGVTSQASETEIKKAYETKNKELENKTGPEVEATKKDLGRAFATLSEADKKARYDETGAEPSIDKKELAPDIIYFKFKQISPTFLDEFKENISGTATMPNNSSMIIDLRGNIGGAVETLPYLLGFWLGQNQYAYDYFKQGEPESYRTKTDKLIGLDKFTKIVVLVDKNTASSAEIFATALKRFNLGVVLGTSTRGQGTVENFFPLRTKISEDETFSALIVRAVTLRDDGQPIEGRGIEPDIKLDDKNWPEKLLEYYNSPNLIEAVKKVI